jgi:hypothetical protein
MQFGKLKDLVPWKIVKVAICITVGYWSLYAIARTTDVLHVYHQGQQGWGWLHIDSSDNGNMWGGGLPSKRPFLVWMRKSFGNTAEFVFKPLLTVEIEIREWHRRRPRKVYGSGGGFGGSMGSGAKFETPATAEKESEE